VRLRKDFAAFALNKTVMGRTPLHVMPQEFHAREWTTDAKPIERERRRTLRSGSLWTFNVLSTEKEAQF